MTQEPSGPTESNSEPADAAAPSSPAIAPAIAPAEPAVAGDKLLLMAVAALGVVYGDIGTSPLYAIKICFSGEHGIAPSPANVLGVLSLVFWSVMFVVCVKYLLFILKADNHGEGGILALMALMTRGPDGQTTRAPAYAIVLVLFGASLLFGDGVITPAISVLSAVEGLAIATTAFEPYILWITTAILLALFMAQKRGTGNIGRVFGVVMVVWFSVLAIMGLSQIIHQPGVLAAVNPWYAARFMMTEGRYGLAVLGGVFLCVTGAEAMYADMGHFGRRAIRTGWFCMVMPCLLLNYFGQGALLISNPEARTAPFYSMVPQWGLYPMVALATAASIIASQALISGAFSINRQAMQLGYCPRLTVVHTSRTHEGQIYIPEVNWTLMIACIAIVWIFKSSESLAAAYGIAVTGDMIITSIMFYVVVTKTWNWPVWKAMMTVGLFLAVDLTFLAANSIKFFQGGWLPILMAAVIFTLMTTWKEGRRRLARHIATKTMARDEFLTEVKESNAPRVPGTAVFLTAATEGMPPILVHHWKHDQALHEKVVLVSVVNAHVPHIPAKQRLQVAEIGNGFWRIVASYGYMQTPNVPIILQGSSLYGLIIDMEKVTYYLGRETLIPSASKGMSGWRKALFVLISRNSRSATAYFGIPPDQVEELGMQVEL